MTPDYNKAATKAMETLINNKICETPISPLPILKKMQGVIVLSFAEMSTLTDIDRSSLVAMFGENQDAASFYINKGKIKYVVAYNQRLPFYILHKGLSRELGHIVLGHDGTRPEEIRSAEAYCFAHHLLCPRPLIKAIQDANIKLTIETIRNLTGCDERCLARMKKEPGAIVAPELNRKVKEQFREHVENLLEFQRVLSINDPSYLADLGDYMNNYSE